MVLARTRRLYREARSDPMSTEATKQVLLSRERADAPFSAPLGSLVTRLEKAEKQSRLLKYALAVMAPVIVYLFIGQQIPQTFVERERFVAADRLQLFDKAGNPRMFLRIYSGVPIMQLMDEDGKPRLSLGLRYDDSPFISLADTTGQTRATFQVTEDESPALRLFDERGDSTFSIN